MPYMDYVQDVFRSSKYRCFKIIPDPPQQIQELSDIINRVEGDKYKFSYYPGQDIAVIHYKDPFNMVCVIGFIRKVTSLKYHPRFPEDFR